VKRTVEETRRRLRTAATAEFAEHGRADGTTVTRIAARAASTRNALRLLRR
jgi:hypothetical protein